ncbi:hypothetical protein B566_EDAN015654 [Ephemera danica]|nr:hypothetical protein B566_EDAN015654 [Ephemera danica]
MKRAGPAGQSSIPSCTHKLNMVDTTTVPYIWKQVDWVGRWLLNLVSEILPEVEESYNNSKNPKQTRYKVFFYWSYQTAICTGKDMFDFHTKKAKLGKSSAFGFAEALWEIENKPDITFDSQQSIANAANSTVLDAASTSNQTPQHKKRKNSGSTEAHGSSSKQRKLSNQTIQQKLQLVRPCFVRLEYLDLNALFPPNSPPSPPSTPAADTSSESVESNSLPSVVTKKNLQDSKSKTSSSTELAPVLKKPSPQDNKSKIPSSAADLVPPEKATGKLKPTCIFCDKTYAMFNQLFLHVRRVHGKYPFCRSCEKFFASEAECRNHDHSANSEKLVRLSQDIFNCTFCEKSFETVSQVKIHMVLNHPKAANTFLTEKEQQFLETLKIVRNFLLKLSEDNENFAIHCAQCKLDASSKDYFENHVELSPHPNSDNCFICGTASESYPQHIEHLKSHCNDSFVFRKCDECQCTFVNCSNYTSHFLNKHSNVGTSDISVHCKAGQHKSQLDTNAVECLEETTKQNVKPSFQATEKEKPSSSKSSTDVESEADSTEYYMEIYDGSKATTSNDDIPIIDLGEPEVECEVEEDEEDSNETENHTETTQDQTSSLAAQENVKNLLGLQKNESTGTSKNFKVHCSACNNDILDDVYFDFDPQFHDCIVHSELKCPFCGLEIPEKEKNLHEFFAHLDKHISRGMRSVECRKCSVWFFNLYNQTIHAVKVHCNTVGEDFKCSTIGEKKRPENSANTAQPPAKIVPPRVRSGIKSKFEQTSKELIEFSDSQLQAFNKDKPFSIFCMSCSTDIPFEIYFNEHIKSCEVQGNLLCAFCGRKFATKSNYPIYYFNHVKNHLAKPFDDYICGCNLNFMNLVLIACKSDNIKIHDI